MVKFKLLLIGFIIALLLYTTAVILDHGWNLFPIFFGEMISMTWSGQFNFDFTLFLIIAGLWVAWRNNFSVIGISLGLFTLIGGMLFIATYLLVLSSKPTSTIKTILIGKN